MTTYDKIRRENPGVEIGECWEGVGYYLGDGSWCDPDFVGMPGELEHVLSDDVRENRVLEANWR